MTNVINAAMMAHALIVFSRSNFSMRSFTSGPPSSMYACRSGERRWPACAIFTLLASGRRCAAGFFPSLSAAAASRTNLSGSSR